MSSSRRAVPRAVLRAVLLVPAAAALAATSGDYVPVLADLGAAPGAEGRRVVRVQGLYRVGSYYANGIAFGDHDGDGDDELILASDLFGELAVIPGGPGTVGVVDLAAQPDGVTRTLGRQAFSVAAGDMDGDGRDDIAVGAPYDGRGRVTIFFGTGREAGATLGRKSSGGEGGEVTATVAYEGSGDVAAFSLACGDLDGDGLADLVLGNPGAERAKALVVFGSAALPGRHVTFDDRDTAAAGTAVVLREFGETTQGFSVAVGDIDGDGDGDLILGDPAGAGQVRLIRGGPHLRGPAVLGGGVLEGGRIVDRAGLSVASGDVDGDGRDDVIIGAPSYEADGEANGIVHVVFGHPDLLTGRRRLDRPEEFPAAPATLTGTVALGFVGYSVAAGDCDGDGRADLLAGAWGDGVAVGAGRVYVVSGRELTPGRALLANQEPVSYVEGAAADDGLGYGAEAGGDVDGDGVGDLAFSAIRGRGDTGLALALLGESDGGRVAVSRMAARAGSVVDGGPGTRLRLTAAGAGAVVLVREPGGSRASGLPGALPVLWEVAGESAALAGARVVVRPTSAEAGSSGRALRAFHAPTPDGPWTALAGDGSGAASLASATLPGAGFVAVVHDTRTAVATWSVDVLSLAAGAWTLRALDDGSVEGFGYDLVHGDVLVSGTLDLSGAAPTGELVVSSRAGDVLERHVLSGGKVKRSGADIRRVVVVAPTLRAIARPPTGRSRLEGALGARRNVLKTGGQRTRLDDVYVIADAHRPGESLLRGDVIGRVMATGGSRAYGEVLVDGEARPVALRVARRLRRLKATGGGVRLRLFR